MATDVEIDRALSAVTATLNDRQPEHWETDRVQEMITSAMGGAEVLTVDAGGGVHDEHGTRLAVIRRTPSGEWITERQNTAAEQSGTAVPAPPRQSRARVLLSKLGLRSG